MRIEQLALRLEDTSRLTQLWMVLPAKSRTRVAQIYARLCVRAAKAVVPVSEQQRAGESCSPKR